MLMIEKDSQRLTAATDRGPADRPEAIVGVNSLVRPELGRASPPWVLVAGAATRAVAATLDGTRRGSGRAAGGNPTGLGPRRAAAALAEAVGQALAGLDPAAVRHVVVGLAGGAALPGGEDLPGGEEFARVWEQAGVRCPVEYGSDTLIAFVAGTDALEGSLLLSGTGACAIAVKDRALAARSDGHGWLLGDRGSGFWLGRQAVLAAMAELDGEGPQTALTALVIESLLPGADADPRGAAPPQAPPPPPPPPP